jgi:hypothetical protein
MIYQKNHQRVLAEDLLFVLAGDTVPPHVVARCRPLRDALEASVTGSNGDYSIILWDGGRAYATGTTKACCVKDAAVMIANGALFQI